MRIQYLFDRPLPANETDSEQVMQTVAALARAGHDVELIVPRRAGSSVDAEQLREHYRVQGAFRARGVAVPSAPSAQLRKLAFARVATSLPLDADVVYTRNLPVLFRLAKGARPFVYETYRPWFDQLAPLGAPMRRALEAKNALGAVLHSHYAASRYAALGVPAERLLVAHNGHDPGALAAAPERDEARRALGIASDARVVTYTGHVNFTKGIDSIVALARRSPELTFLIVGWDGKLGPTSLYARRASNVELVPWQPFARVAWYLKASDVLLLPPKARGFRLVGNTVLPIKLFQYLAAGRPILAPATPDTAELLVDGRNARLVPEGRIDLAHAALRELFADRALAERLAAGALSSAHALTWDARARILSAWLEARLATVRGTTSDVCREPVRLV